LSRKKIIVGILLLAAVASAVGFFWAFGNGADELTLPGIVEIQEIRLGSKVGGRVARLAVNPATKLPIKEGDLVEAGQPLVYFEVPELEAQEAQWTARVEADTAAYDRAYAGPRPEEKEAGKQAAAAARAKWKRLVAGWREEEKRQAAQDLESAKADYNLAKEDFERIRQLYPQSASRAEYDVARFAMSRAKGRYESARARDDMLRKGSRQEDIAEAEADYQNAKNKHRLLELGNRDEDIREAKAKLDESRARLREIRANLREAVVRAPSRAVIEVLGVRKGDVVPPNQPILRVLQADDLWVKVYVPETQLGQVRLNQKAAVTIDSYPERRFTGTIIQIASISEFTPRNVQSADERRHQVFGVKVRVDNAEGIFKSGMAAEVHVPLQK
jgi:multidrug resistance efflux pump